MRTQARGLAQAVAGRVLEKTAPARAFWTPWRKPPFTSPWPDILITCGRRAVWVSRAIGAGSKGRTFRVHIQDPKVSPQHFDLVVAMAHDRIASTGNVIKVTTALHDVTPARLAVAAGQWRERLAPLGPFTGALVGGDTARGVFNTGDQLRFIEGLKRLRQGSGHGLAITPSRRTPPAFRRRLVDAFGSDKGTFVWDGEGDNPYLGILALADQLVVTGDSISMVSEALATEHPVAVFDLGIKAYQSFLTKLVSQGAISDFPGGPWPEGRRDPEGATGLAAAVVRERMLAR